jgi:hypothetical protein
MSNPKLRCPVCSGNVTSIKGKVEEHNFKNNKTTDGTAVVCYGSHLPVFADDTNGWTAGNLMFIRKRQFNSFDAMAGEIPIPVPGNEN